MDISALALWFVCGLGTAVLAAVATPSRAGAAAGLTGFALGVWWMREPFAPSSAGIGTAAAIVAAMELVRVRRAPYAFALAGLLAGVWSAVLQQQGLSLAPAMAAASALPSASAFLRTRRPGFAPPALRDEALLFLIVLGIVAASVPGIAEGWRTAGTLNLRVSDAQGSAAAVMPTWTLAVATTALLSGGLFALWSRR